MGTSEHKTLIAVTKADTIWLVICIIAFLMGCMYATFAEKIAALEDVVFIHGIYKDIE
jgi:hypothetical protein